MKSVLTDKIVVVLIFMMVTRHTELKTLNNNREPTELRKLKQQLANLNCKCSICERSKNQTKCTKKSLDKEVQYEQENIFFPVLFTENMYRCYYNNSYAKCLIPINIVREEKFKDEESETTPENFRCDKSMGHTLSVSEKSTSITKKKHSKYSNLTLCDYISVCSSCSFETSEYEEKYVRKNKERVKFINNQSKETDAHKFSIFNEDCSCMDNFMNSIRPPLQFNTLV